MNPRGNNMPNTSVSSTSNETRSHQPRPGRGERPGPFNGGEGSTQGARRKGLTHSNETPETLIGRTIQWTFDDGPTAGTTYEHTFNEDGSVEFCAVGEDESGQPGEVVRVDECAVTPIAPGIFAISYLSPGGYCLTAILNCEDNVVTAFASSKGSWDQQSGSFEIIGVSTADDTSEE